MKINYFTKRKIKKTNELGEIIYIEKEEMCAEVVCGCLENDTVMVDQPEYISFHKTDKCSQSSFERLVNSFKKQFVGLKLVNMTHSNVVFRIKNGFENSLTKIDFHTGELMGYSDVDFYIKGKVNKKTTDKLTNKEK